MLRVVVAVIFNSYNEILVDKRLTTKFMPEFWELPGGKTNSGESDLDALKRELKEEIGISVTTAEYEFEYHHSYPDIFVTLVVFSIKRYNNKIVAKEKQQLQWISPAKIKTIKTLPTVSPIINRLILPKTYHIINFDNNFEHNFRKKLPNMRLLQIRTTKDIKTNELKKIYENCTRNNIKLILNINNIEENLTHCDGYHLTSKKLQQKNIIYANDKIISVATHNKQQINKANIINADIITLGPVKKTKTHPTAKVLGYKRSSALAKLSNSLVYFLGGMTINDIEKAQYHNAHGVAGISMI